MTSWHWTLSFLSCLSVQLLVKLHFLWPHLACLGTAQSVSTTYLRRTCLGCQAWSSSSSPMKNFTFALITLYYLSLPFFEYHLAPFPFPTFLSTEGNTTVRETQEDPQLSACLGSNKRDLTCQHVSGNREPRCSCLLDSWNQLLKKWWLRIRQHGYKCIFINIHHTAHHNRGRHGGQFCFWPFSPFWTISNNSAKG